LTRNFTDHKIPKESTPMKQSSAVEEYPDHKIPKESTPMKQSAAVEEYPFQVQLDLSRCVWVSSLLVKHFT
jgi:hypothetical protein